MNTTSSFDGSLFPWIMVLMLATIIAVVTIRAFASTRAARSSLEDHNSKERLARLESDLANAKARLTTIEDTLNDV
ncbi:MAG: hypothetical protein COB93_08670 [Sneathiella sp.]|nr:MAG: hypothetical protein COB93_08670 [Sneathiella sp.]